MVKSRKTTEAKIIIQTTEKQAWDEAENYVVILKILETEFL